MLSLKLNHLTTKFLLSQGALIFITAIKLHQRSNSTVDPYIPSQLLRNTNIKYFMYVKDRVLNELFNSTIGRKSKSLNALFLREDLSSF